MIHAKIVQTPEAVAEHYDELDPFYRALWGEHVHHGLWTTGRETPAEAVEALVDHLAGKLDLAPGQQVCDVGCGYGATAERLADRHGVFVTGLTLSARQAQVAAARAARSGRLRFVRQDWLANDLPTACFDRVVAIESSEHMADKPRFFSEIFRTLRPGGRFAICAWLARPDPRPWETALLLEPICREGRLPGMGTEAEYVGWARSAGLEIRLFEELSGRVQRTWTICAGRLIRAVALDRQARFYLRSPEARNRIFALSLFRILLAYRTGSMRYGLLTGHKPG